MLYPAIFIVLCFIYMEPVSDSIIEPKDMMDVVVSVLSKPYISQYPQYFPYEKLLWVVALASALLGFNRVFSLYGFLAMIVIGTFQSMGGLGLCLAGLQLGRHVHRWTVLPERVRLPKE